MALVGVLSLPVIRPMQAQDILPGVWEGNWTRAGAPLAVTFEFQRTDSGYTGSFGSIPLRVTGIPMSKIIYRAPDLHLEIVGDRTTTVFDGKLERNSISGSFKDGDASGTFMLRRAAGRAKPAYHEEGVWFQNGDVKLSGSILIPNDGKKQHPALLFLHGSGAEGRYASRFLADVFARRGIATLIYDKRGVGSSTGNWRTSDFNALAQDAIAGVENLKKRQDIDPRRIANNRRYTIKVFPNADHTLRVVTANGAAFHWPENPEGYLETLVNWTLRAVRE